MIKRKIQPRKTVAIVSAIFLALALWFFRNEKPAAPYLLSLALALFIPGMLSLTFASYFEKLWFGLGHAIGSVNSKIILTIVYFGFLVPLAVLRNLSSRKKMQDRLTGKTAFKKRAHTYNASDLLKPW